MKRVFICNVVPKNLITKLRVSQAGNNFSYNLIEGHVFDSIYTLIPLNINEKIPIGQFSNGIKPIQTRFFNNFLIFRILTLLVDNFILFFSIAKNSNVWFYNITIHNILCYSMLKLFRPGLNIYIIVLDYSPPMRYFDINKRYLKIINKANGIITLTEKTNFKNKNAICLPGVVTQIENKPLLHEINYDFLYSGIINSKRQIELILDVFSKIPSYRLHITGLANDEKTILEYTKKYTNIKYYGYLTYEEYINVLNNITFCLNTRNPKIGEYKFNFPSKLIEYLQYNKILISTIEYPQLKSFKYLITPQKDEEFFDFFVSLNKLDERDLLFYANQSELVRELFSIERWLSKMKHLEQN